MMLSPALNLNLPEAFKVVDDVQLGIKLKFTRSF